jgi:putative ABC transport system permease protein
MPAWQQPLNGMALVVRTASDPKPFVDSVRRAIQTVDAEQPIFDASAMVDVVARSVFLPRISMLLLIAFAGCALTLAAVGIYGVVSYSVAERTREIGVRMALGADAPAMLTLVLRRSMGLVLLGTIVGLVGAAAATRVMTTLLYQVSPLDPLVLATVSVVLASIGLAASVVPARRATRVDPLIALRSE